MTDTPGEGGEPPFPRGEEPPPGEKPSSARGDALPGEKPGSARGDEPARLSRLDPDLAGASPAAPGESVGEEGGAGGRPPGPGPPSSPVVDTRRYRWTIGIFGLVLVVAISIYQFAANGVATTGVPPGQRLHSFAAPLANTSLVGDPNLNPPCTLAKHDPRALNVCLILRHRALVLALFVVGSTECEHQVDALQRLSTEFPASRVAFAAVAIDASRSDTARLIRSHHWTIPVAYDRDGAVGTLYGIAVCPMAELAAPGGIVRDRLIGDHWQTSGTLAPRVRALLAAGASTP